jgi:hypothetical protein
MREGRMAKSTEANDLSFQKKGDGKFKWVRGVES